METHSSILTWEIPWTEEPGELQFMESKKSQTQLSDCTHTHTHTHHTAPHTNVPCSSGVRWRIESVLNSATTWQREAVAAKIQVK